MRQKTTIVFIVGIILISCSEKQQNEVRKVDDKYSTEKPHKHDKYIKPGYIGLNGHEYCNIYNIYPTQLESIDLVRLVSPSGLLYPICDSISEIMPLIKGKSEYKPKTYYISTYKNNHFKVTFEKMTDEKYENMMLELAGVIVK